MAWTKIGNRYYDYDSDNDILLKATYDADKDEYIECGNYVGSTFHTLGESDLDENSFQQKDSIISTFNLPTS